MESAEQTRMIWMQQFSPMVRRAWNHCVPEMKLKPRIIFDYELLYMDKGELHLRIEDNEYTIVPGDIVLFKPGKEHEILGSSGECRMPHIHFDLLYYDNFEEVPIHFKPFKECTDHEKSLIRPDILGTALQLADLIRIPNHSEVHHTLLRLIDAYDRRDPEFILLQKSLVLRILYQVIKGLQIGHNAQLRLHQKALERTVTHLMDNYNRTVSLEELSKIACLSVYHFARLFKEKYGLAPHQFQIRHRIEKAKELLMYSPLSLTAIAEKVGYGSVYAFSKAFKQLEGVSPSQFHRSHIDV